MTNFASLCILSYNRPKYLGDTLRSLEKNTTEPYELIIHDDGSNDLSVQNILEGAKSRGATVIMNKNNWNQGQGVALNRMFNIAKGDPIIKLDADLEFEDGWLEEVNYLLDANDTNFTMAIEPKIGLLGLLHYYHEPVDSRHTRLASYTEWTEHTHILGSAFAVRRECWNNLGPFSEYSDAFAEDWEFQVKVSNSDSWVCALPKNDLVKNTGMGIGKSTVVKEDGSVCKIHKSPYVINS